MSMGVKCHAGSNELTDGDVILPDLRNAKNPRQHADHSITLSHLCGSHSNAALTLLRTYGVMGRRVSFALGFNLFSPLKASWSRNAPPVGPQAPVQCACDGWPRDRTSLSCGLGVTRGERRTGSIWILKLAVGILPYSG